MITAVDPSRSSDTFELQPKLPAGKHILRCVRLLEARKDGSHYTDKDGDRKCLAIFESDSYPNHEGIFQAVYDSRHSITTDRDSKLGRTAKFVGQFIHCAGIPQISKLEEMVELTAHANVVHKGEYVNIKEWFIPSSSSSSSAAAASSSKPSKDLNAPATENEESQQQGQQQVQQNPDDVPF